MLKYFNVFFNYHLSFQLWAKTNKLNKIKQDMYNSDSIFFIYKVLRYFNDSLSSFLDKVYLKNSSGGELAIIWVYSVNVKRDWDYSGETKLKQGLTSLQYLELHKNILIVLLLNYFKNICFTLSSKIILYYLTFHFKQ